MENKQWVPCKISSTCFVNPNAIVMVVVQDDGVPAVIIAGKAVVSDLTFKTIERNWRDALNGLEASGLDLV